MCGIIGVIANTNVSPLLLEGLKKLEYRGYDSSGVATVTQSGKLTCCRSEGKLERLQDHIAREPINGTTGIGHTRWATHGSPTRKNAHPHLTDKVAVVHNGIIENFRELRARLEAEGRALVSDTDTEVIPHLITSYLDSGMSPEEAVTATVRQLQGTFAFAVLFAEREKFLIVARRGSPLVLGYGDGAMYVGSDEIALSPFTSRIAYLDDGDIAHVNENGATIRTADGRDVVRPVSVSSYSHTMLEKGEHKHYMLKEIHEQPATLAATLACYMNRATGAVQMPVLPVSLASISQATLVACGTSHYAGMVGKYMLEHYARLPVMIDIASEFRYRMPPLKPDGLALFISQSGETADTLAALRFAREEGQIALSMVNVVESSMARASHAILPTLAGPEIGVASTKAFTAQLLALSCVTLAFANVRNTLDPLAYQEMLQALLGLPELAQQALGFEDRMRTLAKEIVNARDVLFLGRGIHYPIALEGALKLKELSYIHAEGIAAGELKHGPLALVDEEVPVIALAPSGTLFEKTCSNLQEVAARGGRVIALCDREGEEALSHIAAHTVVLPQAHPLVSPILYSIPLQLLAYHVALARGNDVDQPRNLAKSVTVE